MSIQTQDECCIKIATIEDIDIIVSMAMKFISESNYKNYGNEIALRALVERVLNAPDEDSIVLLYEDKGMIAGITSQFLFGTFKSATELAWWIDPEHRKSRLGSELLEAFEYWAKKVGCKLITMISIDDNVGKYYEKKGYVLQERTYTKEL